MLTVKKDNYELIHIKNGIKTNIIDYIADLKWKDTIDTLGMQLNFNMAENHLDKYMQFTKNVTLGDTLVLLNNKKERFRGIITTEEPKQRTRAITAFDFAFWLNKSTVIKQYNKMPADKAIMELCNQYNIKASVKGLKTPITKIYKDKTISDIIKDIIEDETKSSGKKFRLEMRYGVLTIEAYKELEIQAIYKQADNIEAINALLYPTEPNISRTIEEMKNSVIITSGDEKNIRIVATAKDDKNIKKYGLLQQVESVDDKNKSQAKNIAKNKLKELNKIGESITLSLLGSDELRAGRILIFKNEVPNMKGKYLIKDCEHEFKNNNHICSVTLEAV